MIETWKATVDHLIAEHNTAAPLDAEVLAASAQNGLMRISLIDGSWDEDLAVTRLVLGLADFRDVLPPALLGGRSDGRVFPDLGDGDAAAALRELERLLHHLVIALLECDGRGWDPSTFMEATRLLAESRLEYRLR